MAYQHIQLSREGAYYTLTMNRPERRNALSRAHMAELIDAFSTVGKSDALGVTLAGNGPVFCAGHDFADMVGSALPELRSLLLQCAELMQLMQRIPQVVIARVHALATAAGCQLVATCDLAVAADSAGFALPGGKGDWFCHTPLVAVGRAIPRKQALELAFTGDAIDATTALSWGLLNRVVPAADVHAATQDLLSRATRGSGFAKGMGKQCFYDQIDLDLAKAYAHAVEVMAATGQTPEAQERMRAFVEKRAPKREASQPASTAAG
jgi:enoyl-CoA hydratase/carnithine racemase